MLSWLFYFPLFPLALIRHHFTLYVTLIFVLIILSQYRRFIAKIDSGGEGVLEEVRGEGEVVSVLDAP